MTFKIQKTLPLLFAISLLIISSLAHAQILKCRGNIGFYVQGPKGEWKKIDIEKMSYFEEFASHVGSIKIGKDKRFPAAEVQPFYGISYKINNKDIHIETDKENWFTASYHKNILSCDIDFGGRE